MATLLFKDAWQLIMKSAVAGDVEIVPLEQACGRVLAGDVVSDVAMPPFNKAAMDGYACRLSDLEKKIPLSCCGTIPAGSMPECRVSEGTCARIMTGAPVPEGADCVVMLEDTTTDASGMVAVSRRGNARHICKRAEDICSGDRVLLRGELITAAHCAVLATVGCAAVEVYKRPRVAVLATGSELVEVAVTPAGAQIRNSNAPQLCAQVRSMGALATDCGIVADTIEATAAAIDDAEQGHDVLVLSGGVSEGDYDFVKPALLSCGYTFIFESVAMQPGRPMVFARKGDCFCFGLPGNPVSTFVVFERMVKEFLFALMGHVHRPRIVAAKLAAPVSRRSGARQASFPVRFTAEGLVEPLSYHGSAHINIMTQADGLIVIPEGVITLDEGNVVDVRLF